MKNYIKLKVLNKKEFTVSGRSLIELENDLRTHCCILSIPYVKEYFDFKCLSAVLKKEGYNYFILYTVSIEGKIWKLKVDISEPCTYTCHLPWYVLDKDVWTKICPMNDRVLEYPNLINPIQEDIGIFKRILLKLQNYFITDKCVWARFDLK